MLLLSQNSLSAISSFVCSICLTFCVVCIDEKSEKRRTTIRAKTEEYMKRAEEIKTSLNKPDDGYVILSLNLPLL